MDNKIEISAQHAMYLLQVLTSSQYPLVPARDMKGFVKLLDEIEEQLKELPMEEVVEDSPTVE